MSFTDEELEVIQRMFFEVSVERPLTEEEKELYFKITDM